MLEEEEEEEEDHHHDDDDDDERKKKKKKKREEDEYVRQNRVCWSRPRRGGLENRGRRPSGIPVSEFRYETPPFFFNVFQESLLLMFDRISIDPRVSFVSSLSKQIPRGWKNWPRGVWKTRTGCAATRA